MTVKVTVIMPAYNAGSFIEKAIESILEQTVKDLEILVIDDGSSDGTALIASRFEKTRVLHQDHKGVAPARNLGLREASGEYIAFCDADDLWTPDKLEKQLSFMEDNPGCLVCYCRYRNFTDIEEELLTEGQKELMGIEVENVLATSLVRKKAFDIYGPYDESLPYGEDTEWIWRLKLHNRETISHTDDVLYLRRVHDGNITLSHSNHDSEGMYHYMSRSLINLRKAGLK